MNGSKSGLDLEAVEGLDPAEGVRDPVDARSEGRLDEVVAESLLLENVTEPPLEELQAGGLDLGLGLEELVPEDRKDLIEEIHE